MKRKSPLFTLIALSAASIAVASLSGCSTSGYEVSDISNVEIAQTYADYTDNMIYDTPSTPSEGSPKLVVIPIWLRDSSRFITKKDNVHDDIEAAYFGTVSETGWHSVKTFYEEESRGKLTLDGTVSDWYEPGITYSALGTYSNQQTCQLVKDAVDWFFDENPTERRTDYDLDQDGYLDGVILVYGAPNYATLQNYNISNLWAYTYWIQGYDADLEEPTPNTFFFSSYDFMYDAGTAYSRAGTRNSYGDCSHCRIDTHTFIHEMGHMFGLQDYYDYSGQCSPAGGFSMQDYNVGGHDPYSLMALGWADPHVVTESETITISPFTKNHDLVLLTPEWNEFDSAFDEYILLELYTPTGTNEHDSVYRYGEYPQGPETAGIRVWHVDSRLLSGTINETGDDVYFTSADITSDCSEEYLYLAMSNTYWRGSEDSNAYCSPLGQTYANYNLLQLIRNSRTAGYTPNDALSEDDLFLDGSSFSMEDFAPQFVNRGRLNSGKGLGYEVGISISGSGDSATATLEITKL